jgi:hypothetical protein
MQILFKNSFISVIPDEFIDLGIGQAMQHHELNNNEIDR